MFTYLMLVLLSPSTVISGVGVVVGAAYLVSKIVPARAPRPQAGKLAAAGRSGSAMSARLVVDDWRDKFFYIIWEFEDDTGGTLGDELYTDDRLESADASDWDHIAATIAAGKTVGVQRNPNDGYCWTTRPAANAALKAIKAALKTGREARPWPEWAIKAKGAGWTPPKGWTP